MTTTFDTLATYQVPLSIGYDRSFADTESLYRKREKGLWQRRFWEHLIRNEDDFHRHLDYIHYNPVKHGLAKTPIDWRYSSFPAYVKKGFYPPDWDRVSAPHGIDAMNLE